MGNLVVMPWPPKELSPNARVHWSKRAKAAKKTRSDAFYLCAEAKLLMPEFTEKLHLQINFYPPSRRSVDDDNMLIRCKNYRDGIADYLGVDDKCFVSHPRVMQFDGDKNGRVEITITAGV